MNCGHLLNLHCEATKLWPFTKSPLIDSGDVEIHVDEQIEFPDLKGRRIVCIKYAFSIMAEVPSLWL